MKNSNQDIVDSILNELNLLLNTKIDELNYEFKSEELLNWQEVIMLKDMGCTIGSHTHDHVILHQNQTEENIKYARLGRRINKTPNERLVYGDYLANATDGVKPLKGMLGDIEIVVYHRTFSKMVEQIQASGFRIERAVEPQPIPEMKEGDPDRFKLLTKIPTFMIWVLRKVE